ncbi:MAG: hypothetical protein K8S62_05150 [Candidatus Sabulitectum sp.]|nr:hypothetical protein [Candidatus Sabulitectum sp.]
MRMCNHSICLAFTLAFFFLTGCRTDYDIADVAPEEHLHSEDHDHADGETCEESESDHSHGHSNETGHAHSVNEEMEEAHAGGPSGHAHDAGDRNHGTQWFFNQPWAATFIWKKLFRDALIFLTLAVGIFLATGRRRKR